jgi:hypothetical protein
VHGQGATAREAAAAFDACYVRSNLPKPSAPPAPPASDAQQNKVRKRSKTKP